MKEVRYVAVRCGALDESRLAASQVAVGDLRLSCLCL